MDDIVAVEVRLASGENRYFLTWGRIQDHVDPGPLAKVVLANAHRFAIDGEPVSARVLWSLHPAVKAPSFYEVFFAMCQTPIPCGAEYEAWRSTVAEEMEAGQHIRYLGYYAVPTQPDEPDATVEPPAQ